MVRYRRADRKVREYPDDGEMKKLDGIDAFQWHNWMDGRDEFGLRIGLRKYPDDEKIRPGKSRSGTYARQPTLPREIKFLNPVNRTLESGIVLKYCMK